MARLAFALLSSLTGLILVLPVILLVLPFWIMSACVRAFARLTEPVVAPGEKLIRFDPILAWKPKENLDTFYLAPDDDIYPIVTDSSGWPGDNPLSTSEMVVVGDSFAYGYGAGKGERFWELAPELKIKPIGCPGYDMVQEVQALRLLGDRLAGKLVCWLVYLENDIPDILRPHLRGYRKPFVRKSPRTGRWEIVTSHVRREKWTHSGFGDLLNMKVLALLCSPGRLSDHYYEACRFLIEEAAGICQQHRAVLVLVTVPNVNQLSRAGRGYLSSLLGNRSTFNPDYPDVRFAQACRALRVPFAPAKKHLRASDYKRFETFHWNRDGHRRMVGLLREIHDTWKSGRLAGGGTGSRTNAAPPTVEIAELIAGGVQQARG